MPESKLTDKIFVSYDKYSNTMRGYVATNILWIDEYAATDDVASYG